MSIIALPDNNFRSVNWTLVQPTQVNRSEFTSARQVMQLPGASYWKASADHVPIRGEANVRAWRAFLAKLGGQANKFRLPATEGPQHALANPFCASGDFFTPVDVGGTAVSAGSVERTLATDTSWAAARSSAALGEGAEFSFKVDQTNCGLFIGMNTSSATKRGGNEQDFSLAFSDDGSVRYANDGSPLVVIGPYHTYERWAWRYRDGAMNVYRDGILMQSFAAAPGQTFYAEVAIKEQGASASDLAYGVPSLPMSALPVCGLPLGDELLPPGSLGTITLENGDEQLVCFQDGLAGDFLGFGGATFVPPLRALPAPGVPIQTISPWCLMAMDSPELGYSVDPGALYGFGFSATEAF